jgi:UPF0716 protein FxsA
MSMLFVALLFLVVPLVELYVIVQAAQAFGIGETIVVLVLMSVVGAWLVKQQGVSVWRRFNDTMRQGRVPHREIVDGALILFAGALLLTPGFLSDILGLFLLFPPTRALVRTVVIGRFAAVSVIDVATTRVTGRSRERRRDDGVWDADSWESGPTDGTDRGELDR